MDNAGGHGTNEAKEQYKQELKSRFNISVEFQPPRTPELNLLDLGLWMSMQSSVEKLILREEIQQNANCIYDTCQRVFDSFSPDIIKKVHDRLALKIWSLVALDHGNNTTVESQRGKLTVDPYNSIGQIQNSTRSKL